MGVFPLWWQHTAALPRHYLGVMFSGNRGEGGVVGVAVSRVICICGFVVGVILAHRKEAAQISLTPDTLTPHADVWPHICGETMEKRRGISMVIKKVVSLHHPKTRKTLFCHPCFVMQICSVCQSDQFIRPPNDKFFSLTKGKLTSDFGK